MADINKIPDDIKWKIASENAARLPALYDAAFREIVGKRYDEIEQTIWMELSRTAFSIAHTLSLPVGTAQDLAETMRTVMILLFGLGFKSETLKVGEDRSVIIVRRCPFIDEGTALGAGGARTFHKCMALTLASVPHMNKEFGARFVRTMCDGDRQCEIKIAKAEEPGGAP
jgi:predicted ArsR family transcriptional regulator